MYFAKITVTLNFSNHLLENKHPSRIVSNTTEILCATGKGSHLKQNIEILHLWRNKEKQPT